MKTGQELMREVNQAFKDTYGDPKFVAEMKKLNEEHDALCLKAFGMTGTEIANEIVLAQFFDVGEP